MDQVRNSLGRIGRAWRALAGEQRLAAVAALLLLLTLFLPWYEKSFYDPAIQGYVKDTLTGFGSADFVMASVVLVAFGVLGMIFARGEGRGFHLPGGDGTVIMAAGGWAALLVFYRVIDHPNVSGRAATIGIQWGVFVAFLAAAFLVYAGYRIRAAQRPEPPLPLDAPTVRASRGPGRPAPEAPREPREPPPDDLPRRATGPADPTAVSRPRRRRPVAPRDPDGPMQGQMSFDEAETRPLPER